MLSSFASYPFLPTVGLSLKVMMNTTTTAINICVWYLRLISAMCMYSYAVK